jgi:hypothetical protein
MRRAPVRCSEQKKLTLFSIFFLTLKFCNSIHSLAAKNLLQH